MDRVVETKKNIRTEALSLKKIIRFSLNVFGFFIGRIVIFQSLNPAAPAYMSMLSFTGKNYYTALFFTLAGFITKAGATYFSKYIILLSLLTAANALYPYLKKSKPTRMAQAMTGSVCTLTAGLVISAVNSFSAYYAVLAVLEATLNFALCIILARGMEIIDKYPDELNAVSIEKEDILSLALLGGAMIAGAADVYIANVSISCFFIVSASVIIAYLYGAANGAAGAVILTLIPVASGACDIALTCIFAVAAIFASTAKKRLLCAAVFLFAEYIMCLYLNHTLLTKGLIYSSVLGAMTIFFVPQPSEQKYFAAAADGGYAEELKSVLNYKLLDFSECFSSLARTLRNLSDKKNVLSRQDLARLIDTVASGSCQVCDMYKCCWETNFYDTYQNMLQLLSDCEKKGRLSVGDIPPYFSKRCINKSSFIQTTNRIFEIYKTNLLWLNKISENRELVCQQLNGVSQLIKNLADETSLDTSFCEQSSAKLKSRLISEGIDVYSVIITENSRFRFEILIRLRDCCAIKCCVKEIIPIVNAFMNKEMRRDSSECIITHTNGKDICNLKLVEQESYRISYHTATAAKNGSPVSGDSCACLPLSNGVYLLTLSDGMGSGKQAMAESSAAIELFEGFMSAGFDKTTAINMINSSMLLKSSKESFSTLDICIIDLHSATAEFTKIGAAAGFIKHGSEVEIIKASALPVGILSTVDISPIKRQLQRDDVVVIVSDGVIESHPSMINKENWIAKLLSTTSFVNAKDIADEILENAKQNCKSTINDDMTVIAAKIWRS